jgi:hypothetical protein
MEDVMSTKMTKPSKSDLAISKRTWDAIGWADQLALLKSVNQPTTGIGFRFWHELPQQTVDALMRVDWLRVFAEHGLVEHGLVNAFTSAPDLLKALVDLQREIHHVVKMDVRKHYSLMLADVAASKAIASAKGN